MRDKLRSFRIHNGYTQEQMASLLSINRATYTNIELGYKNPSLALAIKIKKVFDYNNDDIFYNQVNN